MQNWYNGVHPLKVDVHTHVWPDRIAEAALESMTRTFGMASIAPNTIAGIRAHMAESGVDKSIVLGLMERAGQVQRDEEAIQRWLQERWPQVKKKL